MDLSPLLERLAADLTPLPGAKERVRGRMQARMRAPALLTELRGRLAPAPGSQEALWGRISAAIAPVVPVGILEKARALLMPTAEQMDLLRSRILSRLSPEPARAFAFSTSGKWAAAGLVAVLILRASPALFLAPHTVAESSVLLRPTEGSVFISLHGLGQEVREEIVLHAGVAVETTDGEATFTVHDDGNIRLDEHSKVILHDVSDRPEPALDGPTFTVLSGRVWVQGLVPAHLRGIVIATPQGQVTVHEGSISIDVGPVVTVSAWNRHAVLSTSDGDERLVAGEKIELGRGVDSAPATIRSAEYENAWVTQNLSRDAVHQREIAQLQRERRAAQAGILPTSPFYTVKRAAEAIDVLLTFDEETRIQKQLQHATTRLDEAAALLAEGSSADESLKEYQEVLLEIATGSGGGSVAQFLLRQEIAENAADLAAVQPDEAAYALKKAVLEASAALPDTMIGAADVDGIVLVDILDALNDALLAGDIARAAEIFAQLAPSLPLLQDEDSVVDADVRDEAMSLLARFATLAKERNEELGDVDAGLLAATEPFLPEEAAPEQLPLSPEQIGAIVGGILDRTIGTYQTPRARINQIQLELSRIAGHRDEARILEMLLVNVEVNEAEEVAPYVRWRIRELRRDRLD